MATGPGGNDRSSASAALAEYDVVHFEQAGRAKRPFVPYASIEVRLEFSTSKPADDSASA